MDRSRVIHRRLWRWFRRHGRDLPWRWTDDPYHIVVSEVMLQQTQVSRVVPKYRRWFRRFPTVHHLARAPLRSVLSVWSGLGYNQRALRLRELVRIVVRQYDGDFPRSPDALRGLPGLGPYTAAAVRAFAYHQRVGLIDTNIRRVVSRLQFGVQGSTSDRRLQATVERLVPAGRSWWWHEALMDLGSTICTSRQPACRRCPLQAVCRATPAILTAGSAPSKRSTVRFHDSARFWRGRIIAELTTTSGTAGRLYGRLQTYGQLPKLRYDRLLKQLIEDGLVVRPGRRFAIAR